MNARIWRSALVSLALIISVIALGAVAQAPQPTTAPATITISTKGSAIMANGVYPDEITVTPSSTAITSIHATVPSTVDAQIYAKGLAPSKDITTSDMRDGAFHISILNGAATAIPVDIGTVTTTTKGGGDEDGRESPDGHGCGQRTAFVTRQQEVVHAAFHWRDVHEQL